MGHKNRGWLIKDPADGWVWTPHRIAAVAALTEGHEVTEVFSTDDLLEAFNAGWGAAKAGNIYSQEEEAREWFYDR